MKEKPFVLSEDAEVLLRPWAEQRGFTIPSAAFFAGMLDVLISMLRVIFGDVVLAEEVAISSNLETWAYRCGLPPVSMDGVYFRSPRYVLQINRMVDSSGNDAGLGCRPGTEPIELQLAVIGNSGVREVCLVDDVVFSGGQMAHVIHQLSKMDVRVVKVFVGISIGEGKLALANMGAETMAVYSMNHVIDEICQRDFLPGVPRCGRTVVGTNSGMPYILPFGNPGKWASIPLVWQEKFSRECIGLSIDLFEGIEKASGRPVFCSDLDRPVFSLPQNCTRFVDALKRLL